MQHSGTQIFKLQVVTVSRNPSLQESTMERLTYRQSSRKESCAFQKSKQEKFEFWEIEGWVQNDLSFTEWQHKQKIH